MANPKHIAWLLEGVESWNKRYNKTQPGGYPFTPDLKGADLYSAFREVDKLDSNKRIPLVGVDLEGANLAEANLSFADLTDANLTLADLTATWLWNANLTNTTLHFADLNRTNLTAAEPWKAKLDFSFIESPKQHPDNDEPVNTIQNMLHRIMQFRDFYGASVALYFRGELNCGLDLRPSVMRDDLVFFENEMLIDLMTRRPEEFNGMTSALAQWVLAQHHGLKTRFLDITKNPLVALFHACDKSEKEGNKKEDGRIHVFAVPRELVKPFNDDAISIIANVAKLFRLRQDALLGKRRSLLDFKFRSSNDQPEAMRILQQLIRQEKPYFEERTDPRDLYQVFVVEPQLSSERIRAQAGAFLVSAFHERFERDEILKWNEEIPVYAHYKLTIPEECKGDIIKELQLLNVTRETLFPGLDSSATSVTDTYRTLFNDLSDERNNPKSRRGR